MIGIYIVQNTMVVGGGEGNGRQGKKIFRGKKMKKRKEKRRNIT